MSGDPIIKVENLTAGYGETVILKDVNFTVERGEVVVLVGGSGCGKSTLLKHMIGLLPPISGKIVIDGVDVARAGEKEYRLLLKRIGVLFQGAALLGSLTVGENVALPLEWSARIDQHSRDELVKLKLAAVDLSGYENHFPSEISGGMAKRAGIARAMALNPAILFFDEPSAGLDPITSAELDDLILTMNRVFKTTMVIVTHELSSIHTVADRAVVLDKARKGIAAVGHPKTLAESGDDPVVYRFFNPRGARKE
ncbi:MAG: ATP-binding cassette domain-containing protein [Deltaproteobacteria bacterium]|nr:ATP-binding cassette domain-containing protein [Deltaproteobacteria bacterium]